MVKCFGFQNPKTGKKGTLGQTICSHLVEVLVYLNFIRNLIPNKKMKKSKKLLYFHVKSLNLPTTNC
jgi:hypothetical protein